MSIIEYIEEAIQNGKSVTIKYEKYGGELSTRTLSDIHYSDEFGEEYIEGFCHLRNERRTFKISRIREVDGIKAITYTGAIGKNKSAYNPNLSNSISRPATTAELNKLFDSPRSNLSNSRPQLNDSTTTPSNYSSGKRNTYSSTHKTNKSEGCYIATMVYGDYNHPQVMVLRRYRDEYLLKSFCGRCFVKIYYYLSPKVVRILHNKKRVNIFIRWWLDRHIRKLRKENEGVDLSTK